MELISKEYAIEKLTRQKNKHNYSKEDIIKKTQNDFLVVRKELIKRYEDTFNSYVDYFRMNELLDHRSPAHHIHEANRLGLEYHNNKRYLEDYRETQAPILNEMLVILEKGGEEVYGISEDEIRAAVRPYGLSKYEIREMIAAMEEAEGVDMPNIE